jgi:hypothetical protein
VICILTPSYVDVYDVITRQRIGRETNDIRIVAGLDSHSMSTEKESLTYSASFKMYKKRIFLLVRPNSSPVPCS